MDQQEQAVTIILHDDECERVDKILLAAKTCTGEDDTEELIYQSRAHFCRCAVLRKIREEFKLYIKD